MNYVQTFENFLNEGKQADLIVPANDAHDMEEECDYIVELLKKAGVNAGCEAGIGEIEVYLKSKGDLAKAKKALEKNALEYTTNEAIVSEGTEYAVVLIGGSIGDKPRPRDAKGYAGMDAKTEELFSLDKAKEKATRMNKTVLSPGEKKHYGLKYIVVPVENGKFIKESIDEGKTIGSLSNEDDAIYVEAKDLLAKELQKAYEEVGKKVQKVIDKAENKGLIVSNLQAQAANDLVDVYRLKFLKP